MSEEKRPHRETFIPTWMMPKTDPKRSPGSLVNRGVMDKSPYGDFLTLELHLGKRLVIPNTPSQLWSLGLQEATLIAFGMATRFLISSSSFFGCQGMQGKQLRIFFTKMLMLL